MVIRICPVPKFVVGTLRPHGYNNALCEKISELGGIGLDLPTFEIIPCSLSPTEITLLKNLTPHDWILATSQHVAQTLSGLHMHAPIVAIGQATACALQPYTTQSCYAPAIAKSEALLTYLGTQTIAPDAQIIILSGNEGRDLIINTLRTASYHVTKIICYNRRFRAWSTDEIQQLQTTPPNAWIAFSTRK